MRNFKILLAIAFAATLLSCNDQKPTSQNKSEAPAEKAIQKDKSADEYDPQRGLGKYTAENVELGPIDAAMAAAGEKIAEVKCFTCHKPTEERLVGPGWKGVTERHTAEWIMNFISNPNEMINVDPALQAQLEICLVRMPNQGLNDQETREILEYMRQNDSKN